MKKYPGNFNSCAIKFCRSNYVVQRVWAWTMKFSIFLPCWEPCFWICSNKNLKVSAVTHNGEWIWPHERSDQMDTSFAVCDLVLSIWKARPYKVLQLFYFFILDMLEGHDFLLSTGASQWHRDLRRRDRDTRLYEYMLRWRVLSHIERVQRWFGLYKWLRGILN